MLNFLESKEERFNLSWARKLFDEVENMIFLDDKKYQSLLFFDDFYIETYPKILENTEKPQEEDKSPIVRSYITNQKYNKIDAFMLLDKNKKRNSGGEHWEELLIIERLWRLFSSIDNGEFMEDDPMIEFKNIRKIAKKYVKLFSEQINKFPMHPLAIAIKKFGDAFTEYLEKEIETIKVIKQDVNEKESQEKIVEIANRITNRIITNRITAIFIKFNNNNEIILLTNYQNNYY